MLKEKERTRAKQEGVMRIKYPKAIGESEEDLMSQEQRLRGQKPADRVRMLRLLKSATVQSLKDCAPLIGYSLTQLTRWWECYRAQGLTGLLKQQKPVGKASRMTPEAWAGLLVAMRKGHLATMEDAREYLEREWGMRYKNGKSLWWLAEETSGQVEDRVYDFRSS
jgi:transposase